MNMAKDLYDDIESIGRTNKVNHGLENEEKWRFLCIDDICTYLRL